MRQPVTLLSYRDGTSSSIDFLHVAKSHGYYTLQEAYK